MRLPGTAGPDQIFAIGDIHGQAATLEKALNNIASTPRRGEKRRLVFLGDLIDRGPENLRTLQLAMNAKELAAVDEVEYLWGNHELMFLDGLAGDVTAQECWIFNGGLQLLVELDVMIGNADKIAERICEKMRDEIAFMKNMKSHTRAGDLLFVHAGINPLKKSAESLALDPQDVPTREHWAWIRDPFLHFRGPWDDDPKMVVVHGHTSVNQNCKLDPDDCVHLFDRVESHRRINLDAGAAGLGQAMVLEVNGQDYDFTLVQEWDYEQEVVRTSDFEL
jgi:serine/threonine protein phosphatase 1